jgi:hypothetical protein
MVKQGTSLYGSQEAKRDRKKPEHDKPFKDTLLVVFFPQPGLIFHSSHHLLMVYLHFESIN